MKPLIGITAEVDEEKRTRIKHAYITAIEDTGGIPLVLPYTENEESLANLVSLCDGFVFSGGADIDPAYFGEEKKPTCGAIQEHRDRFELALLSRVIAAKKPILAICRGMQVINVALGGSLYQDVPTEYETALSHKQSAPVNPPWHDVFVLDKTVLRDLAKKERITGNSFHHQAIKSLGRDLSITATAEDGIVEAYTYHGDFYLRGYQWHPERLYAFDADNRRLFEEFIEACIK